MKDERKEAVRETLVRLDAKVAELLRRREALEKELESLNVNH